MESPLHKCRLISLLAASMLLGTQPSWAANDELRQLAKNYVSTVKELDADLNNLSAMDQKCLSQEVVYDPSSLLPVPKQVAKMFKGPEMAQMDAAVQKLGQELATGKKKLDETSQRIQSARDALEKLTGQDALKVTGVDACLGGANAQDKVLSTAQTQVDKANLSLSLGSDPPAKKTLKVSTTIESLKTTVSQKAAQPDFLKLIKACTGPAYAQVVSTLQDGVGKLAKLQSYAENAEKSVTAMGTSLTSQTTVMKKQTGCNTITPGKAGPAAAQSTITDKPKAADSAVGSRVPASVAPLPPEKPASVSASQRIQSGGSIYTGAPTGVPAAADLSECYADTCSQSQVRAYQTSINQYISDNHLPITPIATDGIAGTQTANAWRAVMGTYNATPASGDTYVAWGAQKQVNSSGVFYYTFPPAKITTNTQLANFFQ